MKDSLSYKLLLICLCKHHLKELLHVFALNLFLSFQVKSEHLLAIDC